MSRVRDRRGALPARLERLEDRRLLAVTPGGGQESVTGKDAAATNYPSLTGAGTSIAILDTGVDYNHPALGGGWGKKVVAGYDYVDNDADPMDTNGHGTGVAALAAGLPFTYGGAKYQGVAPGADVIAFRIDAGNYSFAKEAPLAEKALQWVIANAKRYNIVAVNMSFGKGHYTTDDVVDPMLSDEFATLKGMGLVLVSSSGNDGLTQFGGIEYPGSDPSVYSIGAVYPDGSIWEKTERGQYMDLLAPGANVVIPYYDVATKAHVYISGAYGTSFSAPWAAGMTALLKQLDPTLTAAETMSIMKSSGATRSDAQGSWQLLNINNALAMAYAQGDDAYENNDTAAAAKALSFGAGDTAELTGLKLLLGDADWFKFTLDRTADVDWALTLGFSGAGPQVDLLNANGAVIKRLSAADGVRLGPGTYYLRVNAPTQSLAGSYGLSVHVGAAVASSPGTNGSSNGIAYDAAGRLYLVYYDEVAENLKFAVRDAAGVWGSVTTVDSGFMAGQFVSLALDSLGHAGIAYYDANNADLKYAHFNGSSWDVQTVDAQFTTGYYPSLQYGAGDAPVISYYSKTSGALRFAAWGGSAWALSTIDSAGDVGRYSSLAFNPLSGRWSVAYEDTGHGTFKYANQGRGGWAVATVDAGTRIGGGYISLAFSAKTKLPAMSYYDAYNADLKYAAFNGSRWSTQAVATKGTVGLYSALRIDPGTGLADILYYNKAADSVMRATQSAGGAFGLSQVTTDGGRWVSRALNADGVETLAYVRTVGEIALTRI